MLKILAMLFMLCDHMWATIVPGNLWLTCVGRLAFPIFAFQISEGFVHTHDLREYLKRMLLFALITEIPFNLMSGGWINPFHQNVMFTFWIALLILRQIRGARQRGAVQYVLGILLWSVIGFWTGMFLFVDYYGYGILMVILFYITRDIPYGRLLQLAGMVYINFEMIGGLCLPLEVGTWGYSFPVQGLAVLALIPIWLYNGQKGKYSGQVQKICYLFYPAHILVLALLGMSLA